MVLTTVIAAVAALAGSVTSSLFLQIFIGLYFAFIVMWVAVSWQLSVWQVRRRRRDVLERRKAMVEHILTRRGGAEAGPD